ncbi:MAG: RHS repeat-associated core domain-containing protein [Lachnospiraceae bacterium]|nr:RHS repeat-associated core domain-containing protein [Lachnospiraceae bacterium]
MARYTYDAWGKVTGVKDKSGNAITGASHVANINPFRYRGYYFDGEIGLYYLQSRYYDPVVGRFVNSDESDIICDLSGFREALNYYVYCSCNPVSNIDENGKWKSPKIVAFGIQVEANVSFLSGGL